MNKKQREQIFNSYAAAILPQMPRKSPIMSSTDKTNFPPGTMAASFTGFTLWLSFTANGFPYREIHAIIGGRMLNRKQFAYTPAKSSAEEKMEGQSRERIREGNSARARYIAFVLAASDWPLVWEESTGKLPLLRHISTVSRSCRGKLKA